MRSKIVFLVGMLVWAAHPAASIGLSLDENRERRGSVGFVDMQKVFKAYPETLRSKEHLEELVRQTEEEINLRKAELLRLRRQVLELKNETTTANLQPPGALPEISPSSASIAAVENSKSSLKSDELSRKEAEFKDYQSAREHELLDLESRKTELLLGKIGRAIADVAHQEGISVVIDKSNILFGHDAVDLTSKVLNRLRGNHDQSQ